MDESCVLFMFLITYYFQSFNIKCNELTILIKKNIQFSSILNNLDFLFSSMPLMPDAFISDTQTKQEVIK